MKLVQRFELPLTSSPTLNTYSRMHWAKRAKLKKDTLTRMLVQCRVKRSSPLRGKPTVIATRHSSSQPDQDSAWTKVWLDCLLVKNGGLGFLVDDSPLSVDVRTAWEKASPKAGRVVVEVWEEEAA